MFSPPNDYKSKEPKLKTKEDRKELPVKDIEDSKRDKLVEKPRTPEISDKQTNELIDKRKIERMEVINGDHFSEKINAVSDKVEKDVVKKLESDERVKDEKVDVDMDDERSRSSPESQIQIEHSYSRKERNPSSSNSPASESELRKKQEMYTREHDYTSKSAKSPLTPKLDDNRYGKSSTKEIKKSSEKLVSHLLKTYLPIEKTVPTRFKERDYEGEVNVCFEFLTKGNFFTNIFFFLIFHEI